MRHAYIEPSAWVKRYYREAGTDLTNYLFILDDPGTKIDEKGLCGDDGRSKSRNRPVFYPPEEVTAGGPIQLIFQQVIDEDIRVNENAPAIRNLFQWPTPHILFAR